jgi:hypothetical protein
LASLRRGKAVVIALATSFTYVTSGHGGMSSGSRRVRMKIGTPS